MIRVSGPKDAFTFKMASTPAVKSVGVGTCVRVGQVLHRPRWGPLQIHPGLSTQQKAATT